MFHTFRGKRYKIELDCPYMHNDGEADAPADKEKEIRFARRLYDKELLETYIHECLHACFWDMTEESVDLSARDIAAFLWRLGYRNDEFVKKFRTKAKKPRRSKKKSSG